MSKEPGQIPMDEPLAYFLTWTTYGTWLPGDQRGWTAKPGEVRGPDSEEEAAAKQLMTEPACRLGPEQRSLVEKTIAAHCAIRAWRLHAVYCGTNHVHVVVTAPQRDPDDVMDQLKAWCTRRLKEQQQTGDPKAPARQKWWTQRGSKRWLFTQASLEESIEYVREGQAGAHFTDIQA